MLARFLLHKTLSHVVFSTIVKKKRKKCYFSYISVNSMIDVYTEYYWEVSQLAKTAYLSISHNKANFLQSRSWTNSLRQYKVTRIIRFNVLLMLFSFSQQTKFSTYEKDNFINNFFKNELFTHKKQRQIFKWKNVHLHKIQAYHSLKIRNHQNFENRFALDIKSLKSKKTSSRAFKEISECTITKTNS